MQKLNPSDVDDYIHKSDADKQDQLKAMRNIICKAIPHAKEVISYQMPAYRTSEILVYFAAFKDHISLFPTNSGIEAFKKDLTKYTTSKGTIQFSLSSPLPKKLITDICKFRSEEAKIREEEKKKKQKK
jgi:uncharacterized protein YdhG (YjbR/CyaY superfamily)